MITINFTQSQGEIRRINGVNLAPRLKGAGHFLHKTAWQQMSAAYRALRAPVARFHDAPNDNPGMRLVDPHLIFANFHADADDPRNYYFRQTDDYLRQCHAMGTRIHYRLGPSIEHAAESYFTCPPEDNEQWVRICVNIVRHYTEGWNNGFAWHIPHWTIWEEPDNGALWAGEVDGENNPEQFFALYELTARRLKDRFPRIKVGTCAAFALESKKVGGRSVPQAVPKKWVAEYLAYCRRKKAPLDFLEMSLYKGAPDDAIGYPAKVRKVLDSYGFKDAEVRIAEWRYVAHGVPFAGRQAFESPEGCYGTDGAAFAAAVLTGWQDEPLAMSNYYTATNGLFDRYYTPRKVYYGFRAFCDMTAYPKRVAAQSGDSSVKVLAGTNADGEGAVLVSAFQSEQKRLTLDVQGAVPDQADVLCVNSELNLEPVAFTRKSNRLILDKAPGSAVYLIKGFRCTGRKK